MGPLDRDLPSIALHSLFRHCRSALERPEGDVFPFDDGLFEARILYRRSLLVGVRTRSSTRMRVSGLYLEHKGGGELTTLELHRTDLPQRDSSCLWFALNDPPEFANPGMRSHLLLLTDPPTDS